MHQIDILRSALLIAVVTLLSACASARPVMEWQDETYTGKLNNLLIIAVAEDSSLRRSAEDAFVEKFATIGVAAAPGYALIADAADVSRTTVEAAIADSDIEAVLITRLLGVEEIESYRPPMRVDHYRSYHRYYARALDTSSPGYYQKFKLLTLETMLYQSTTGELIWSMQSETMDSDTPQAVIDRQVALTVERLQARGLLVGASE